MKVQIGGVQRSLVSAADLEKAEDAVANLITANAVASVMDVSVKSLTRLEERIRTAATAETARMMDVIVAIMDKPQPGLSPGISGSDLTRGTNLFASGRLGWKPLSDRYARSKDLMARSWGLTGKAARGRSSRYFTHRGTLRNYLKGRGASIIKNRLGGMDVQVDKKLRAESYMSGNNKYVTKGLKDIVWESSDGAGDAASIVLGRVTLTMFPRLSPAMAPMLATRRWTDAGDGAMEKAMFGGTKTLSKLLNRRNAYRPIITPVVQFFMLSRIPAAVNRAVTDNIRKSTQNVE
jgi:hypothetical protein